MELSFRQNCAVESAALHNPQRLVQIFFQPQVKEMSIDQSSTWFRALSRYDNVQVIVIDDEKLYFKDSPLEDWYRKGEWRNYRAQHMSDYIRMVTMKKGGGGIYLDLDIVTLKSCDCLLFRNFVTTRDVKRITNAVFHLDRDHRLIDAIVKKQSEDYDRDNYVYNGPEVFTLVITDLCLKGKTNVCTNLRMLRPQNFHPKGATSDAMKEVFE
jgi:lactosylceramide 4-alpha-galactosyltransferase